MRVQALIIAIVSLFPSFVRASEFNQDTPGWIGVVLGQHFTGKINHLAFCPIVEFRSGYRVSEQFALRMDLGTAITKITNPDRDSFKGAGLLMGHLSLVLLHTPELSPGFRLNLGGTLGVWFTAIWGDNLLNVQQGSKTKYLEEISMSYGVVAGLEWNLSSCFSLTSEVRYNLAMVKFGGSQYNTGGLTLLLGFQYRLKATNL